MRIKCFCDLYVSEDLKDKKEQVLENLTDTSAFHMPVFILTLAGGGHNQLEFFSSVFLRQPYYEDKEIFVVGLAGSYFTAVGLVRQIFLEVMEKTKDTGIREYIRGRQKAFEVN